MARVEKCQECKLWKAHGMCEKNKDYPVYTAPDDWCGGFEQRPKAAKK